MVKSNNIEKSINPFDVLQTSDSESGSDESFSNELNDVQNVEKTLGEDHVGLVLEKDLNNDGIADDNGDDNESESEYGSDEIEYDENILLEAQLQDAQEQWEESLQQLNKVLNWLVLPLFGKFLGRRTSKVIWKKIMNYFW